MSSSCLSQLRISLPTGPVYLSLETLARQRVFQLARGYDDQDDGAALRTDPFLARTHDRLRATDAGLASQATVNRLENAIDRQICYRLAVALLRISLQPWERGGKPTRLVLDLESTDDPTFGKQEGAAYPVSTQPPTTTVSPSTG